MARQDTPRVHVICQKCADSHGPHDSESPHSADSTVQCNKYHCIGEWFDACDGLEEEVVDKFGEMTCGGELLIDETDGFDPYEPADYNLVGTAGLRIAEEIGQAIEDKGTIIAAIMVECDVNVKDARHILKNDYRGAYKDLAEYAEEYVDNHDECNIPSFIRDHINWESLGESLTEDDTVFEHEGKIHVVGNV